MPILYRLPFVILATMAAAAATAQSEDVPVEAAAERQEIVDALSEKLPEDADEALAEKFVEKLPDEVAKDVIDKLPDDLSVEQVEAVQEAAAVKDRRNDEASLNEDPEARRRAEREARNQAVQTVTDAVLGSDEETPISDDDEIKPEVLDDERFALDFYGSARVHVINAFDPENGSRSGEVSDGNSRIGVRGEWQFNPGWYLFGRYEAGVDLVDQFSTRGDLFGEGGLTTRLGFVGLDSDNMTLTAGQNWSAYYQVAGATDRFAIFGGSAGGVYSAGTGGRLTGTGRAEDVIQGRIYMNRDSDLFARFKPFQLNMQYQFAQPIPLATGEEYDHAWGASAMLEMQNEFLLGVAYNRSVVPEGRPAIEAVGIDGDATAFAATTRAFGERWYAALLYSRLKNMEFTDLGLYYDAVGIELYAQWEFTDNWWLIGGGNWLDPDDDQSFVGEYEIRYAVLGGRYSFDSFRRMLYIEYRIDDSHLSDGRPGKDEVTIGVRWDFGE